MRERKKTGVHGTLEMIPMAWKFNSKKLLLKTLNSRMNIIETRALLNMDKKKTSSYDDLFKRYGHRNNDIDRQIF